MKLGSFFRTLGTVSALWLASAPAIANESTADMLSLFVDDYAADPMQQTIVFGIEVDGKRWHVRSDAATNEVVLLNGFPDSPVFYFKADTETLEKIHNGMLTGITAMAAATSADLTPLDVLFMDGYEKPRNYDAQLRPLIFHFWTRGYPEVVPFGMQYARIVHGAPGNAMYYAKDFRSAIYHVPPKLGADQAPTMTVPFPRVLVVLAGTMTGTVSGVDFVAPKGHYLFIPPNQPAHVWNDGDTQLDMMFLMFGDGA
ncbi:MAG: hypothetical protein AAF270_16275 [Pseudomonadota bacterium]